MSDRGKEIAKFACGAAAFHALVHAYFWYSGTTLRVGPLRETPSMHKAGTVGNAALSLVLGYYAWGRDRTTPRDASAGR